MKLNFGAMRCFLFLSVLCCVSAVHKKMEEMKSRESFVEHSLVPLSTLNHEIVFAVKQRNIDVLDSMLMEMSTPGNPKYQQWLTFKEVGDLTSNPDGAAAIRAWLTESGVSVSWESAHKDYLKATAPIGQWETLLNTTFSYWTDASLAGHKEEHKLWVRAKDYSIPEELEQHVHTLFNTVHPPPVVSKAYYRSADNSQVKTTLRMRDMMYNVAVTPSFLNSYYGIASNAGSAAQNQSVFETSNEYFSPTDLAAFQTKFGTTSQKAVDIGGFTTDSCSASGTPIDCFEGNLDIQYIMAISQATSSIYWYVGGNDPFVDYVTDISNMANPSQSNSISWGTIEQQNSPTVMTAFNTETLKLTSQGVTVMVSTGDNGVANFGCTCSAAKATSPSNCACQANSGSSISDWTGTNSWTGTGYFPSFPATCPYVTAVGATMFPTSSTRPEIACQSQLSGIITTGGGFSTYYAQPSWQTSAVSAYFAGLKKQPSSGYNAKGRGIPDISLLGVNYQVIVGGKTVTLFGTSASSPVFAGMISLVNAGRRARGLGNVGFINPTLYTYGLSATMKTFTDVDSGNNRCCSNGSPQTTATLCCAAGFNSTAGWDPVTGWGSVTYTNLTTMLNGAWSPTRQPTIAPSVRPTPTPLPSKVPTFQPTPVLGTPTLAPSTMNVVAVHVTQIVTGTGITAATFNNNPINAQTFQQAVMASVSNVESVVIGTVWNYGGTTRRMLQATSSINLNYTISVNSGGGVSSQSSVTTVTNQLTTAVDTGAFTTSMNSYAITNAATMLETATSDDVSVASAFGGPTSSPVKSPSAFSSTDVAITVSVVVLFVVGALIGCASIYYCKGRSASSPPQASHVAYAVPTSVPQDVNGPPNLSYANPLKTDKRPSVTASGFAAPVKPVKAAKPKLTGGRNDYI